MKPFKISTSRIGQVVMDTPVQEMRGELRDVETAIRQLETHATLLRLAIQIKEEQDGSAQPEPHPDANPRTGKPKLHEAIVQVLADAGGPMALPALYMELEKRNWAPDSENARAQVSARLSKMVAGGQVKRPMRGLYALPTSVDAQSALVTGDESATAKVETDA